MSALEKTDLQLGYIPLLDCVAILWANHQGYFEQQGLNVELVKEASWASLRDRLAFGFLDAAHCLSAMLPAAALGEDQLGVPLQTPLVLSTNRAFISLSQQLSHKLNIGIDTPTQTASKICKAINSGENIRFAHVFKHSIHHYCLREWLALADETTAKSIKLLTVPPPFMVDALINHSIDGYCVGEPWNTQGEILGISQIIAQSPDIIPPVADKVLAFTQDWAQHHPNTLNALTQAIKKAQNELKHLEDYAEVWAMLMDYDIIRFECSNERHVKKYYAIQHIIRNFIEDDGTPKLSDMQWIFSQMQKWLNTEKIDHIEELCRRCIV